MTDDVERAQAYIGIRMKEWREHKKITKEDAASFIGASVADIDLYENGHMPIHAITLFRFAACVNVPVSYFLSDAYEKIIEEAEKS
jgi:transcriptional regulator with XRE-family HTH domain